MSTTTQEITERLRQSEARRAELNQPTEAQTLDTQIEKMRDELEQTQLRERREQTLNSLLNLAETGTTALREFEEIRADLANVLTGKFAALLAAKQRLADARRNFIAEANSECGSALSRLLSFRIPREEGCQLQIELDGLIGELSSRGVSLNGVLIESFCGDRTVADRRYEFDDLGTIGQIVDMAFRQYAGETAAHNQLQYEIALSPGMRVMVDTLLDGFAR
ncbi:MAG: hypothetical protein M3X11_18240 [Acidobacteriota bacterium]|nr:hypothetical protein [Acidobacteriota bacterium]